jgi:Rps23 Pro-64 3,4-dihydroxylase Tpa1-like proline 4-hydroxylase
MFYLDEISRFYLDKISYPATKISLPSIISHSYPLKLSRNDIAIQRMLDLCAKKKVIKDAQKKVIRNIINKAARAAQILAVQKNQKSKGVRTLISVLQIPYLPAVHILSLLDSKSIVSYVQTCKIMQATVIRHPIVIKKALQEYNKELHRKFIHENLIPQIIKSQKDEHLKFLSYMYYNFDQRSNKEYKEYQSATMRTESLISLLIKKDASIAQNRLSITRYWSAKIG